MKCKKRSERKEAKWEQSWKPEQEKMRFQWAGGKRWRTGRNWNSEISSEWCLKYCYITVVGDDVDIFSFLPYCSINSIVSIFLSKFPHLPCEQEGCFSSVSDRVGHVLPPDWSVLLRLSLRTSLFYDARHFFYRMFSTIVDVEPGLRPHSRKTRLISDFITAVWTAQFHSFTCKKSKRFFHFHM